MKHLLQKLKPFFYIGGLYILVSFILRIVFIFHPITTASFSFIETLKVLFIGGLSDVFIIILASSFLALYFLFLSNAKYDKPYGVLIFSSMLLLVLYTAFVPNNIFSQYGGSVQDIALIFFGLKTFCFGVMLFLPKYRVQVRNVLYFITLFIYSLSIIFNAVSEYFFWNEFGIRYNFIAVDYLIYTNEVIGNIMESYPVLPLFSVIFIVTLLVTIFIFKRTKVTLLSLPNLKQKFILLVSFLFLCLVSLGLSPQFEKVKASNIFSQEVQANGVYKFYYAFTHSELDYFQFYPQMEQKQAENLFLKQLSAPALEREISPNAEETRKNVVLISIESLSAEFMAYYGNQENITPFLDSLAQKSLFFTNLYATGNRTVRGLEALTLCIPPTPGESIVKRKDNKNKFTTGSVFKSKGYQVKYLYGGFSYFDNMKDFFSGNGYDIIDRSNFKPEEITFANIWGVCDEDMARKAVKEMTQQAKQGKPFFNHWMTVSNHRPFTYPNGKIDIPGDSKSRSGGVKYTDYSLKVFFELAKKEDWFKDTIFVIVADHCASSAGKTELPLDKYRIPCLIYSEEIAQQPKEISSLVSQIDVMPTVFGLLNFKYTSKFLGEDVLKETYKPRAYIATYQDLGYIEQDRLTIISPINKTKQYELKLQSEQPSKEHPIFYDEILLPNIDKTQAEKCVSAYQSTAFWIKSQKLNK